jgi:hypothetical protein
MKKLDMDKYLSTFGDRFTYGEALAEVLAIRDQRQKVYADDWKEQADWEILALLKMKVKRLEHFIIDRKDEKIYEGKKDCYIDLVNYALFGLQNLIDGEAKAERGH